MAMWSKITGIFGGANHAVSGPTAAGPSPADDGHSVDTDDHGHNHIDDNSVLPNPRTSSASLPQNALGLDLVDEGKGDKTTPVDTTPTTTEEKIYTTQLEANASSTSETASKPIDENHERTNNATATRKQGIEIHTFDNPPPVWSVYRINNKLDLELSTNRGPFIYKDDVNDGVVAQAKAEGIKIRDFAAKPAAPTHDIRIPEVFNAHEKALHFHYMRWTYHHGIFDLLRIGLTTEDVDRLFTIGFITIKDLDFLTGRTTLCHGAYRRLLRATGIPTYNGQKLAPRGRWTISNNTRRPTQADIFSFIGEHETNRFRKPERFTSVYQLTAVERPAVTKEWLDHRYSEYGLYGLKRVGIDDKAAKAIIRARDTSYFRPGSFEAEMSAPTPVGVEVSPELVEIALRAAMDVPPDEPVAVQGPADHPEPTVTPEPALASESVAVPEPVTASEPVLVQEPALIQETNSVRGRDSEPRGTKRGRSPSTERGTTEDSPRLNRARKADIIKLPHENDEPAFTPLSSPCVERTQRMARSKLDHSPLPTIDIPRPQGQKRARDSDEESEFWFPAAKRHRDENSIPSTSLPPSLEGRKAEPLRRQQRMGIDFERGIFYELAPDDVRRVHGAAFPGTNLDNEETHPPFAVRRPLQREPRVNIDLNTGRTLPLEGEQHGWCFTAPVDESVNPNPSGSLYIF